MRFDVKPGVLIRRAFPYIAESIRAQSIQRAAREIMRLRPVPFHHHHSNRCIGRHLRIEAHLARVADPGVVSGAGTLLTLIGGFVLVVTSRGLLSEFERKKVYDDALDQADKSVVDLVDEAQPVGASA